MTTLESRSATALGSIPGVFREVAARQAETPALEGEGVVLTFGELDRLTNRVAQHLLARGGNEPIAALGPIEPASLVLAYGALKAGRIWSPLDPRDPPERTRAIVEQLGGLLVRSGELDNLLSDCDDDPGLELDPFAPAVVYFTSGSTGRPKGAVKCHQEFIWLRRLCETRPGDRFALVAPLAFTASYLPVFGGLLGGATVCCFDPAARGIGQVGAWLEDSRITLFFSAPSVLHAVGTVMESQDRKADSVRLAIVAGELCRGVDLEAPRRTMPNAAVINLYGSSEAGTIVTTRIAPGEEVEGGPIPLREVCPWISVQIVDAAGNPMPTGEAGDIRVRGREVSLGYWNDPEQTAERFLPASDGERIVVTGDRGRVLQDGSLEHLGRSDRRVKVHGQTVDPEEVENALAALPAVREAVVSAVWGADGSTALVAHVVPDGKQRPATRDLRLALAKAVPPYMIPSAFVSIEAIPHNERGKVDREALTRLALDHVPAAVEYVAPRTATESALAEIVAGSLALDDVGVNDDLFDLGADSIALAELVVGIGERLGVDLLPADLYEASTIAALADRVDRGTVRAERVVTPLYARGSGTPFFVVAGAGNGGMAAMRNVARRLARPTYSFIPRGFERRALPDRTIEQAATRYVAALRGIQSTGPYLVGGYSFGTLVGYEIAQQLRAAGEEVALLVLLDPATSAVGYRDRVKHIAGVSRDSPLSPRAALARLLRHSGRWVMHSAQSATAGLVRRSPARQFSVFYMLNMRMSQRYRPKPYSGTTIVLRTDGWNRLDRTGLGGDLLTGERRVVNIGGGHNTMLQEPHSAPLAELLCQALGAADPSHVGVP